MKETYKKAINKREVQRETLRGSGRFIGLGGPDIQDYVKVVRKAGFDDITIYEKDVKTFTKQFKNIPRGIKLVYGDITDHLGEKNTFYDLDFCASIVTTNNEVLEKISKLKRFSLTFSLRPIGLEKTIERLCRFFEASYVTYYDTAPMVVFFNHKKRKNVKVKVLQ